MRLWIEITASASPRASCANLRDVRARLQHARFEGTGIGLAIVRKAVARMGGTVGIESEMDKGSKFWIELRHGSEQT